MMRTLSIQIVPNLDTDMAQWADRAKRGIASGQYQGEYLTFPTAALFFKDITPNRWDMVNHLLGRDGAVGVRALARALGRDVRRVHEDAALLVKLGLLEKTETGALCCPYVSIHIDMKLVAPAQVALAKAA